MKLKSFHWTRRTVVFALIGLAVLLALAVAAVAFRIAGSVIRIRREASVEQLALVVPRNTAAAIYAYFRSEESEEKEQ